MLPHRHPDPDGWKAHSLRLAAELRQREAEAERLRDALDHAAQALSGCVCSMADAELMDEITLALGGDSS